MRMLVTALGAALMLGGCAGEAGELAGFNTLDAISVSVDEGVEAYHSAATAYQARRDAELLANLGLRLKASAVSTTQADAIVSEMATAMVKLRQDRDAELGLYRDLRRLTQMQRELVDRLRDLVIYRSSIGDQWKQFIKAQQTTLGGRP